MAGQAGRVRRLGNVAHVPLATWTGSGGPETQADTIAGIYWELHTSRNQAGRLYNTL